MSTRPRWYWGALGLGIAVIVVGASFAALQLRDIAHHSFGPSATQWTLASMNGTQRILELRYLFGACSTFERVSVDERTDEVVINVFTRDFPNRNNCTANGIVGHVTVQLGSALGSRRLFGCDGGGPGARRPVRACAGRVLELPLLALDPSAGTTETERRARHWPR